MSGTKQELNLKNFLNKKTRWFVGRIKQKKQREILYLVCVIKWIKFFNILKGGFVDTATNFLKLSRLVSILQQMT